MSSRHFALNHMTAPQLPLPEFFALVGKLGLSDVEIRNDISGNAILDGTAAAEVRSEAARAGVSILTINALQKFNRWSDARRAEAIELADYARDCGAKALILVPANDGTGCRDDERVANTTAALKELKPILADRGLIGLVEPLGFVVCSLRSKREAAAAIDAVDGRATFKITHDTFHHYLAGEPELFPELTGLVHISGVNDPKVAVAEMADSHRVLVDANDRLGNIAQLKALFAAGYTGPVSFEPFAEELRHLDNPEREIGASLAFIRQSI
ncbi:MAG: TIM barrel protein [Devosia sp.]